MRVLFVAPFGLGKKTTVWARTLPLAQQLTLRQCPATIVIPPWDTPHDAGRSWRDGGVDLVNVKNVGGAPLIVARMLRAGRAFSPDLIHIVKPRAHAGLFQWIVWQTRRLFGDKRPLLLDIDDWEQAWTPINRYSKITARFLAWQEEWGIRHADAITAASRWLYRRANEYAPQTPLLYLPNGVDDTLLHRSSAAISRDTDGKTVLFFSRYVEVAPDWLADFAAELLVQAGQTTLIIAGAPLQSGAVQSFQATFATRKLHPSPQIEWRGAVAKEDVDELLTRAACAIFPAHPSTLQLAKCSVRLANTLLHGVPVVASAVGEQAHYGAEGAALLVEENASPGEFARAVASLLHDKERQAQMIAAARRHLAEHYSWRRLGERLLAFYEQVQQKQTQ